MGKLVVLMFTAFVDMVGSTMILPLIPFYATRMGANGAMLGVILASYAVAQLVSSPGWGRFSDRYGRRPAILVGLIVSSVAYVVFAFTDSLPLLLISRFVQGVGGGTVGVLQAYVADSMREEDRAKSLGWLSAATSLGVVVGPAFGSFLTVLWGRRAPGLGAALLCLAISAFASRYLRESREKLTVERTARPRTQATRGALLHVITHPEEPAARLILIYAIAMGGFYGTSQFMPLVLANRFHVTEKNVGYFFMYFGFMGVIIRTILLGPVVRRFGEPRTARIGVLFLAAGLCLMAVSETWGTLFASFTLMPLGTAFLFPCVTALLSRAVPARERGLQMGVQQSYGGISRVVFPLGAGLIVDRFGTGVPFMLAGLLVLATLGLTRSLVRRPVLSAAD
jgi:multidrug resistance protein